jgi:Raf kinase inhibitor-like YbhB/YbcL family protein
MVLTSTAFTEGMTIPAAHTCDGANGSPPLSWTAGPAGTLSYAVVLTDKSNNLVHAGIYDIPSNVTSLPMNVEKVAMPSNPAGSKQVLAYNNMAGYAGPCPGPMAHTYEFMLYAVDIATLPGVMTNQKGALLVPALQAHDLATTTLTGKASTSFTAR